MMMPITMSFGTDIFMMSPDYFVKLSNL